MDIHLASDSPSASTLIGKTHCCFEIVFIANLLPLTALETIIDTCPNSRNFQSFTGAQAPYSGNQGEPLSIEIN